jgi:hypothetical protein
MAKSKADTFEGLGAEAAAPVKRVRSSNKAKTFGQILGNAIDEFAAMDPAVREKVLATLNAQYPAVRVVRNLHGEIVGHFGTDGEALVAG